MRHSKILTAGALGLASVALFAVPSGAHVGASLDEQDGTTVTVTFDFHHGCDGEPTTGLKVKLPDGTTAVTAQDPDGWTSTATDTEIDWTGGSVPDGDEAAFTASMTLTATDGETVSFPTIQSCPSASNDWIQIAEPGGAEPENPAPTIVMGTIGAPEHDDGGGDTEHAATDDEHATDTTADGEHEHDAEEADPEPALLSGEDPDTETAASTSDSDDSSNTGLIIGVVVVVALLAGGGVLLANRKKAAA